MKFVDAAGSYGVTPSWKAREIIDKLKKEVKDEGRKEERK